MQQKRPLTFHNNFQDISTCNVIDRRRQFQKVERVVVMAEEKNRFSQAVVAILRKLQTQNKSTQEIN